MINQLVVINSMMVGLNQSSITGSAMIDTFLDNLFFKRVQAKLNNENIQLIQFDRFEDDLDFQPDRCYLINANLLKVTDITHREGVQFVPCETGDIFSSKALKRVLNLVQDKMK
ncbi:hypothetical protein [Paucilactobacillus sp. N302-9]